MKKILIYEYITGGGLLNEDLSSDLMSEARMILSSTIESCKRSKSYDYSFFVDHRLKGYDSDKSIIIHKSSDLYKLSLLNKYDYILPILPENHFNLLQYVNFLEKNNLKKIISNSKTINICSDKLKFFKYMDKHHISTIPTYNISDLKIRPKKYILKDRLGAGCSYVRVSSKRDLKKYYSADKVIQPFIEGKHYSLSVFFSENNFRLLTFNKQNIIIRNKMIKLKSLSINVPPILYYKNLILLSLIKKSLPGLFGFVGIDIIIKDNKIYVIEINPRLTTSYTGLYETIGYNMIDLLDNHKYIKNVITSRELNLQIYE